jgi:hypothetical protein
MSFMFITKNNILNDAHNLGTKLYNKFPNYLKNLESLKPLKKFNVFFITTYLLFSR